MIITNLLETAQNMMVLIESESEAKENTKPEDIEGTNVEDKPADKVEDKTDDDTSKKDDESDTTGEKKESKEDTKPTKIRKKYNIGDINNFIDKIPDMDPAKQAKAAKFITKLVISNKLVGKIEVEETSPVVDLFPDWMVSGSNPSVKYGPNATYEIRCGDQTIRGTISSNIPEVAALKEELKDFGTVVND